MLNNYSRVRLLTDRFVSEELRCGATGYVIEVYGDGKYEVEFSDANGISVAQIVASETELAVCEPSGVAEAV